MPLRSWNSGPAGISRLAAAERGVELDPNSGDANIHLAMVLRYAGKSKVAIPVIRKALRLEPMAPDICVQNLVLLYFQSCGREKGARKEAAEVLRINPEFTVESYTKILPYRNPSDRDHTAQGLRKAGLP